MIARGVEIFSWEEGGIVGGEIIDNRRIDNRQFSIP
jgi:hypothetical protein